MNSKKLGILGENLAIDYLKEKGYKILDRNYFKKISAVQKGEIDVVAEKEGIISFIEVKTSSFFPEGAGFFPEQRVDFQKQKQLIKLAKAWLLERRKSLDCRWQIDVVSVKIDQSSKKTKIRHLKNVVNF